MVSRKLDLSTLILQFEVHNRSESMSPATVVWYNGTLNLFHRWLREEGVSCLLANLGKEEARQIVLYFQTRKGRQGFATSNTVNNRVRDLRAFLGWPSILFTDDADLNRQGLEWSDAVANDRVHGTTHRVLWEMLSEERPHLGRFPERAALTPYLREDRKVARDCFGQLGRLPLRGPLKVGGQRGAGGTALRGCFQSIGDGLKLLA